ncbi:family 20 glycosylhydrolase, partial [bacterium]|nr:family 20 glycosylhydrolase [bacterium]
MTLLQINFCAKIHKKFPLLAVGLFFQLAVFAPLVQGNIQNSQLFGYSILPKPQSLAELPGHFSVQDGASIWVDSDDTRISQQLLSVLQHPAAAENPLEIDVRNGVANNNKPAIQFLRLREAASVPAIFAQHDLFWQPAMDGEGYLLLVTADRISVIARSDVGWYYAALTLAQLFENIGSEKQFNGAAISDWPAMKMRGISLDISRGQVPTTAGFQRLLDYLARWKLNTFMLYLEDMFPFERFPEIGKNRGALSEVELKVLQELAAARYIQIVPIFQSVGHMENWLIRPEFYSLAAFPGAGAIDPTRPGAEPFISYVTSEVAEVFESPYFHFGMDECWDIGRAAQPEWVDTVERPQRLAEFLDIIAGLTPALNKQPIFYGDMFLAYPELVKRIPENAIIMDWQYRVAGKYPSAAFFRQNKVPLIVSPGLSDWRKIYPDYQEAGQNIRAFIAEGHVQGSLGAISASWGDYGGENFHEFNWYGYALTAECAWSSVPAENVVFNHKYFRDFYGTHPCEMDSIYAWLAQLGADTDVADFWRYPFYFGNFTDEQSEEQVKRLQNLLEPVISLLQAVSGKVYHNKAHLKYLSFAANRGLAISKKLYYGQEVLRLSHNLEAEASRNTTLQYTISAMCGAMAHELQLLGEKYKQLWLEQNRPENLDLIMGLYDRQKYFWRERAGAIRQGDFKSSGELTSQWIVYPNARIDMWERYNARFRTEITVPAGIHSLLIQTMGQSDLYIYFDDELVGRQLARRSVSLHVEAERVKVWDLTKAATPGTHILRIDVHNYEPRYRASVNVYGEMTTADHQLELIQSDEQWQVQLLPVPDMPPITPNKWVPATIIAPHNFT